MVRKKNTKGPGSTPPRTTPPPSATTYPLAEPVSVESTNRQMSQLSIRPLNTQLRPQQRPMQASIPQQQIPLPQASTSAQAAWFQQRPQQEQQQGSLTRQQYPQDAKRQYAPRGPSQHQTEKSQKVESQQKFQEATEKVQAQAQALQPACAQKPISTTMFHMICPNKGSGTRGKTYTIETNYLALDIRNMVNNAYHYDISIEPNTPKRLLQNVFSRFRAVNFPKICIAFDGQKNAYAPDILDLAQPVERNVDIIDPENGQTRSFIVAIKEVKGSVIPLSSLLNYHNERQYDIPMRAIQCLDIVLKSAFQRDGLSGVQVARSFYMAPGQNPVDLGDFYELWIGLFQSTILGQKPFLNVDIAHKAFPMEYQVIALIKRMITDQSRGGTPDLNRELEPPVANRLRTHLKGLRIGYNVPGNGGIKTYKFLDLADPAYCNRFENEGVTTTVLNYFKLRGQPIQYAQLPCLKVGNALRSICLPAELCFVLRGQAVMKKCTENQTRAIIREAATSTDIRKKKIMKLLEQIDYNRSETVRTFGLRIDNEFAQIPARVLDPPKIQYGNNQVIQPRQGVWRGENTAFLQPQNAVVWGVLKIDGRTQRNSVQDLCNMLLRCSQPTNMQFDRNYFIEELNERAPDAEVDRVLLNIKRKNATILFCIIPDRGDSYARVKQSAEIRCGVLTQCIKACTVLKKRNDGSTISNILLKVNAKLNGTNHKLERSPILLGKCMFIGADVTHPSPDQSKIPSVVGVAASHDSNAFCYNICWRLQDPRTEMIQDFREIIKEQLQFYKQKNNGELPFKLLYYRDGVSEGQFQEVMGVELNAMYEACQSFGTDYGKTVKITMVVVQKRHHTRFFPGTSGIGRDDRRNNNVPAGTIVDTTITHPNETHFYLVSHQSIQGVAKPTKYCVLHDDSNINIDILQALTYDLCHMFSRCNRSVSYPAPTYYAHLAAYRGRVYIEGRRDVNMRNLEKEWRDRTIQQNIIKGHPMYFV